MVRLAPLDINSSSNFPGTEAVGPAGLGWLAAGGGRRPSNPARSCASPAWPATPHVVGRGAPCTLNAITLDLLRCADRGASAQSLVWIGSTLVQQLRRIGSLFPISPCWKVSRISPAAQRATTLQLFILPGPCRNVQARFRHTAPVGVRALPVAAARGRVPVQEGLVRRPPPGRRSSRWSLPLIQPSQGSRAPHSGTTHLRITNPRRMIWRSTGTRCRRPSW